VGHLISNFSTFNINKNSLSENKGREAAGGRSPAPPPPVLQTALRAVHFLLFDKKIVGL
jgi:hypothetical protein